MSGLELRGLLWENIAASLSDATERHQPEILHPEQAKQEEWRAPAFVVTGLPLLDANRDHKLAT